MAHGQKKKKKSQNIKQKKYCNKFNKEFENGQIKKILKIITYTALQDRVIYI